MDAGAANVFQDMLSTLVTASCHRQGTGPQAWIPCRPPCVSGLLGQEGTSSQKMTGLVSQSLSHFLLLPLTLPQPLAANDEVHYLS